MPSWNESHHARAAEFVRLVTEAVGRPPAPAAPAPIVPLPTPRPLEVARIPKPAAATSAAVFKSIPWKK